MNSKTKKIFDYILSPTIILILISLLLTVIVDSISRGSIYESLNFIKNRPMTFLFNSTIVLITLSITLLTKRKIFSYSIISSIWIISAISNNVIVNLRGTPLTGNDLRLIKSGPDRSAGPLPHGWWSAAVNRRRSCGSPWDEIAVFPGPACSGPY